MVWLCSRLTVFCASQPASWIYSNKKWSPADGGAVDPQAVRRMQDLRNLFYVSDLTRFPMFQSFASARDVAFFPCSSFLPF